MIPPCARSLWQREGAEGVKTGYTKAAGRILVSSTSRNNRRLVVVTINAPDDWKDHMTLVEQGFKDFSVKELIKLGDVLASVEVVGGDAQRVNLVAEEGFFYALSDQEQVGYTIMNSGFVYAPIAENQNAGYGYILVDGKAVGKVPLVYSKTVERVVDPKPSILDRILRRAG